MAKTLKMDKVKGVPAETSTEEWREMSAAIAYALWSEPTRADQPNESDEPADDWDILAADFRARVRAVLRQILAEGVRFQKGAVVSRNEPRDKAWWDASARLSWLLWLRKRRETNSANEALELAAWEGEAKRYRAYVRSALKQLGTRGIHIEN